MLKQKEEQLKQVTTQNEQTLRAMAEKSDALLAALREVRNSCGGAFVFVCVWLAFFSMPD